MASRVLSAERKEDGTQPEQLGTRMWGVGGMKIIPSHMWPSLMDGDNGGTSGAKSQVWAGHTGHPGSLSFTERI